jgi:serine/threonine protein kinase
MNGEPDTSVLRDFVNGRLSLDQILSIQNYLKANPDALERLGTMEDDSFIKAFREGARIASTQPVRNRSLPASATTARTQLPAIDHYRLVRQIKDHDLVSTWAAWLKSPDPDSTESYQRRVIIKIFRRTDQSAQEDLERFQREAETLRKLDHPNIVRYIDSKSTSDYSYLTMEYLEGIDLSRLITAQGTLLPNAVAVIATQILQGLNYLYEQRVIHRDIKPSNVMLCSDGVVRLIDFGLARPILNYAEKSLTRAEQFLGTIDYVSPEQAMEPTSADIRSDLYSLGCTLFKLLTGNAPFSNRSFDNPLKKVVAHALAQPPKLSTLRNDLPAEFCECIEKFLAKNPSDRYQTPAAAIIALAPWYEPNSITAIQQSIQPLVQKRHEDLWQTNIADLHKDAFENQQLAKTARRFLFFALFSIIALVVSYYFFPKSWLSGETSLSKSNSGKPEVRVMLLGEQESTAESDSAAKAMSKNYLREGYYVGNERNLRNKSEQKAGVILSDDVFIYTTADNAPWGTLRRMGCVWTRVHGHELEKQGKYVYVEEPAVSGYLILEVFSETDFKAICWRGSDFTLSEALEDPTKGYFHSVIEMKWWSTDTKIAGSAIQLNQEIAANWPRFLSKYAPRCVPDDKIRQPQDR